MRRLTTIVVLAASFLINCATIAVAQDSVDADVQIRLPERVRQEIEARDRLLIDLAIERCNVLSDRGEVWIMSAHVGETVKKWKDDGYTLVSLPAAREEDLGTVKAYAYTFNSCNLDAADQWAQNGNYEKAAQLYQRVLRCGVFPDVYRGRAEEKFRLLDELARNVDVASNREKFLRLVVGYSTYTDLPNLERTPAIIVTNILEVARTVSE